MAKTANKTQKANEKKSKAEQARELREKQAAPPKAAAPKAAAPKASKAPKAAPAKKELAAAIAEGLNTGRDASAKSNVVPLRRQKDAPQQPAGRGAGRAEEQHATPPSARRIARGLRSLSSDRRIQLYEERVGRKPSATATTTVVCALLGELLFGTELPQDVSETIPKPKKGGSGVGHGHKVGVMNVLRDALLALKPGQWFGIREYDAACQAAGLELRELQQFKQLGEKRFVPNVARRLMRASNAALCGDLAGRIVIDKDKGSVTVS